MIKKANRVLKSTIKIVGGKCKGIHLDIPPSQSTRASKSILRESLFNTIVTDVADSIFIELFGGSGSIGCEALSREAKEAIFFERDDLACEVLRGNLEKLKSSDGSIKYSVFSGDSFVQAPKVLDSLRHKSIIYLDPPFSIREEMEDIYSRCFGLVENIENENLFLVIFEHMSELNMPKKVGRYELLKSRKFGKSTLSYYVL